MVSLILLANGSSPADRLLAEPLALIASMVNAVNRLVTTDTANPRPPAPSNPEARAEKAALDDPASSCNRWKDSINGLMLLAMPINPNGASWTTLPRFVSALVAWLAPDGNVLPMPLAAFDMAASDLAAVAAVLPSSACSFPSPAVAWPTSAVALISKFGIFLSLSVSPLYILFWRHTGDRR